MEAYGHAPPQYTAAHRIRSHRCPSAPRTPPSPTCAPTARAASAVLRRAALLDVLRLRGEQARRRPCRNLQQDFRCGIHESCAPAASPAARSRLLRRGPEGLPGHLRGTTGARRRRLARQMFEVFPVVRQLHELLKYPSEALRPRRRRPHPSAAADARTRRCATSPADAVQPYRGRRPRCRGEVNPLLLRGQRTGPGGVPEARRTTAVRTSWARLRGANLRGASLRGASCRGDLSAPTCARPT